MCLSHNEVHRRALKVEVKTEDLPSIDAPRNKRIRSGMKNE